MNRLKWFLVLILTVLVVESISSTEVGSNVTLVSSSPRIHRIKPYRIQRRILQVPEESQEAEDKSPEDENSEKRKPRRKLLIYKSSGYKPMTDKAPITVLEEQLSKKFYLHPTTITTATTTGGGKVTVKGKIIDNSLETSNKVDLKSLGPYGNLIPEDALKYRHGLLLHHPRPHHRHHHHDHDFQPHHPHSASGPPGSPLPYAIDPASPILLAHTQHNPLAPFHPQLASGLKDKKKKKESLISSLFPLDTTLFTAGVVVGWLFWAGVLFFYSYWGDPKFEPLSDLASLGKQSSLLLSHNKMDRVVVDGKYGISSILQSPFSNNAQLAQLSNNIHQAQLSNNIQQPQLSNNIQHPQLSNSVQHAQFAKNVQQAQFSSHTQQAQFGKNTQPAQLSHNAQQAQSTGAQYYQHAASPKPIIVKIEPGKPPQFFQTARALSGGNGFSFARVLDMIAMAQETYERFDFQSLDCQKKALCELQQKQADFGETGRKISSTFTFFDALQDLPMPSIIQSYLKEYKEAIVQGKNSSKDCALVYPKCDFSIKDVFVKYSKKTNKMNKDKDI